MFRKIELDLGDNYKIISFKNSNDIAVLIYHDQNIVGTANLTTDQVDVNCITSLSIQDEHVNYKLDGEHALGEVLIKFLIKFPSVVRKPEFRFILDVPENLKTVAAKYHFNRGEGTSIENEIMVRKMPLVCQNIKPEKIVFKRTIDADQLPFLLLFLQRNAYWQKTLTIERLKILVQNSQCFYALLDSGEIVGFSRALTNGVSFASLWDVVVDQSFRGKGIGTALMNEIFSDATLSKIPTWILFTDTAKKLYEKFGFAPESDIPDRKLVHKLRLQETCPSYMSDLISLTSLDLTIHLDKQKCFKFLFGDEGKRHQLSFFWKNTINSDEIREEKIIPDNKKRNCCHLM